MLLFPGTATPRVLLPSRLLLLTRGHSSSAVTRHRPAWCARPRALHMKGSIEVAAAATKSTSASAVTATYPFYFDTGYAVFANRPSRPFPPPFLSLPAEPLTTSQTGGDCPDSRTCLAVGGQTVKGISNGDDAVIVHGRYFLGVNDGVGAWATKERGHAGLWSRLIAHFWALETEKAMMLLAATGGGDTGEELRPIDYLQTAFEQTQVATAATVPDETIYGTTTACSAILHHRSLDQPVIYATNLGDCAVLVIRPADRRIIYHSVEQWHWFDCPRQLGTNSPDVPRLNAVVDVVDIRVGDVVLVVSDGVSDNLWQHEVCRRVCESVEKIFPPNHQQQLPRRDVANSYSSDDDDDGANMTLVAQDLMEAARQVAKDPFAESPFMERAVDEGLPMEGGKLDDISVVVGMCRRRRSAPGGD